MTNIITSNVETLAGYNANFEDMLPLKKQNFMVVSMSVKRQKEENMVKKQEFLGINVKVLQSANAFAIKQFKLLYEFKIY